MTRYQAWYRKREWARTWHAVGPSGAACRLSTCVLRRRGVHDPDVLAVQAVQRAAYQLASSGVVESIVVPDGVDPNDYTVTTIPGVVWRARASWPTDNER